MTLTNTEAATGVQTGGGEDDRVGAGVGGSLLEPTRDPYPYKPYPGFKDPDDWREFTEPDADQRFQQRSRVACSDAKADHVGKHEHHDHPFCAVCQHRLERWESGQDLPTTAELRQRWLRFGPSSSDEPKPARLPFGFYDTVVNFHDHGASEAARTYAESKDCGAAGEALLAYLDSKEDDKYRDLQVHRRAIRHLIVNGRFPADTYDPDRTTGTYLDADQLDELPEPEPLIDGILNRHTLAILRGRDHTFKTFIALDWALALATGKGWQGRDCERVPVLYIAGEGAHGLAARIKAWEQAWHVDVDPDYLTVRTSALNMHRPGPDFEDLLTRVDTYGLVVVDTLRRVSGAADGNSSEMGQVIDNLERLKRATADGTVLTLAHTDKGDNDSRGYSGIEDDADTVWHSKRETGSAHFRLELTKMKDGPDGTALDLKAVPSHGSLIIEGSERRVGEEEASRAEQIVMQAMTGMFAQTGATATELIEATGLPKSTFYWARGRLIESGELESNGPRSRQRIELPLSSQVQGPETPESRSDSNSPSTVQCLSKSVQSSPTPLRGWTLDSGLLDDPRNGEAS